MSTKQIVRLGLMASVGTAGLIMATSANAQSRYGNTISQYESGQNCGQACVAPAQGRYATPAPTYQAPAPMGAPVYVDCAAMGTCAPAPTYQAPVYSQPATVYSAPSTTYQPAPTYSQYSQAPASCPAGTTAQADGTCMQSGSTSYGTTSSYSTDSYSSGTSYSTGSVSMGAMADCPAGTTMQSDGTCMQGGSSSYSTGTAYTTPSYDSSYSSSTSYDSGYSSTPSYDSYSSSSYGSTGAMADCPAGTTAQADGTCMQGGSSSSYVGQSVEIYTGDASTTTTPSTGYGYQSDGSYGANDYLPIRK